MTSLLIRNAHTIATQNDAGDELHNASILVHDGLIASIGPAHTLPDTADEVIDARGHLVDGGARPGVMAHRR